MPNPVVYYMKGSGKVISIIFKANALVHFGKVVESLSDQNLYDWRYIIFDSRLLFDCEGFHVSLPLLLAVGSEVVNK